jgi:hypothetical protein
MTQKEINSHARLPENIHNLLFHNIVTPTHVYDLANALLDGCLLAGSDPRPCGIHYVAHNLFAIRHNRGQQINRFFNFYSCLLFLFHASVFHASFKVTDFASSLDLLNLLHGLYGLAHEVAIILDWSRPSLFELKCGVDGHFFAARLTESFGPRDLTRVALFVKRTDAFGAAKTKLLAVVPDKHHAVARIARTRTKIALIDAHDDIVLESLSVDYSLKSGKLPEAL